MGCLFCKIMNSEIPSEKVYENKRVFAFKDINPQAKVHALFIHKDHTEDLCQLIKQNVSQLNDLFIAIREYAQQSGLDKTGFRVIINQGKEAGQEVWHTHIHLLGGERLGRLNSR